jgi:hypothetical protein
MFAIPTRAGHAVTGHRSVRAVPTLCCLLLSCFLDCSQTSAAAVSSARSASFYVYAGGGVRAENGRAIFYKLETTDTAHPQIQIFDDYGTSILSLNPLAAVPDARDCAVWDASIGPSGLVAVAAVFTKSGLRPVGALLVYRPDGSLSEVLRPALGTGFLAVEVDRQDHIWALSGGTADHQDPKSAPVLVEYDRNGRALGSFFTFADFPKDAAAVLQGT